MTYKIKIFKLIRTTHDKEEFVVNDWLDTMGDTINVVNHSFDIITTGVFLTKYVSIMYEVKND